MSPPPEPTPLELEILGCIQDDAESTDLILKMLHGENGLAPVAPELTRERLEELVGADRAGL